jgi:hypothetical protein
MKHFLLFLDKPKRKGYNDFFWDITFLKINKQILDDRTKLLLFFNTPTAQVIELIEKHQVGTYIIVPFDYLITENKLLEAQSFEHDDSKDNFFAYLDSLQKAKNLDEMGKAFIDSFKHLFDYDVDTLLDKINAKGNVENLNAVEKYCLEKITQN